MRIFLRPLFSIAATKFLSSQEFMDERSMGSCDDSLVEITCSKQHLALMVDQRHDAIVRS
jgi:hypothetical protein